MNGRRINACLIVVALALLAGCTVTPVHTTAGRPSFDGNAQNSGLIGYSTNDVFRLITPHSRDRYNALIEVYGKKFAPPLQADAGLQPFGTNYLIDSQHWAYALTMNRWRKEGLKP